jgi:hypothetical protein
MMNGGQCFQKHAGRNAARHKEKKELFISKFNDLFDIAHADALQMMKLKPQTCFKYYF